MAHSAFSLAARLSRSVASYLAAWCICSLSTCSLMHMLTGRNRGLRHAQLDAKNSQLAEMTTQLNLLKDMVRARKADVRTKDIQNQQIKSQLRRKVRLDAPPRAGAESAEVSPSLQSEAASSHAFSTQRRGPAPNMMEKL